MSVLEKKIEELSAALTQAKSPDGTAASSSTAGGSTNVSVLQSSPISESTSPNAQQAYANNSASPPHRAQSSSQTSPLIVSPTVPMISILEPKEPERQIKRQKHGNNGASQTAVPTMQMTMSDSATTLPGLPKVPISQQEPNVFSQDGSGSTTLPAIPIISSKPISATTAGYSPLGLPYRIPSIPLISSLLKSPHTASPSLSPLQASSPVLDKRQVNPKSGISQRHSISSATAANATNAAGTASSTNPFSVPDTGFTADAQKGFVPDFDINEIRTKLRDQWYKITHNDSARVHNLDNSPRRGLPKFDTDIVSQGLISEEEAEYRLHVFRTQFQQRLPILSQPSGVTNIELRREKPMLFLTIMAIVSGAMEGESSSEPAAAPTARKDNVKRTNLIDLLSTAPPDSKVSPSPRKFYTNFNKSLIINNQCIESLMYEIMIRNKKTLELLESLILINLWYNSPEMHIYHKSHILTNLCIIMAIDMGLGGYSSPSPAPPAPGSKEEIEAANRRNNDPLTDVSKDTTAASTTSRRLIYGSQRQSKYDQVIHPFNLLNPHTYQCRKLWLCVYIASVQLSSQLKRPMNNVWSMYTEECCEILEKEDRPGDERLAAVLARLYRIIELVGEGFQSADQKTPPDMNDPCIQTLVKYLGVQMNKVIPPELKESSQDFAIQWHSLQLILHKPVLYTRLSPRLGRSPYSNFSLAVGHLNITLSVARSLGTCYSSSVKLIQLFNDMTIDELVSAPLTTYARIVLAVSIILKMRALYLTVPEFKNVCSVTSDELQGIHTLMSKMDQAMDIYPFSNCVLNYSLVLRILIYHSDRLLNFYWEDMTKRKQQQKQKQQQNEAAGATNGFFYEEGVDAEKKTNGLDRRYTEPGSSPLDILSNIAADSYQQTTTVPSGNGSGSSGPGPVPGFLPVVTAPTGVGLHPQQHPPQRQHRQQQHQQQQQQQHQLGGISATGNHVSVYYPAATATSAAAAAGITATIPGVLPHSTGMAAVPATSTTVSGVGASAAAAFTTTSAAAMAPPPIPSNSSNTGPGSISGQVGASLEDGFPMWLFMDESWKDLVSGAEALSGFETI